MINYKRELILGFFIILINWPLIFAGKSFFFWTPDIQYVMAKVLWVLEGDLYTDPLTGYVNFHPPFYHLFLSMFIRFGCNIDNVLPIISLFIVCATCIAMFLVIRGRLNDDAAILTVLLFPFIINYMGHGDIFLATAFPFSLPFYLFGLWTYISHSPTRKRDVNTSILWGVAFLISPVYVFLIGCTFGYELIWKKNFRRLSRLAGIFLLTISPFFYQGIEIYRAGMDSTATFSIWGGFPDKEMMKNFIISFLSPKEADVISWQPLVLVAFFSLGVIGIIRNRPIFTFPVIAFIAYIFTFYHFAPQYANRIHFIMSFIVVGYAVWYLMSFRHYRKIYFPILLILVTYGISDHSYKAYNRHMAKSTHYKGRLVIGAELWNNLDELFVKGERILATSDTYRFYLMSRFPVHALSAWRTAEYFQINQEIAESLEKDYTTLMESSNIHYIDHICERHSIRKCLIMKEADTDEPALRVIALKWSRIYEDDFFILYEII
jgi:hypothetical protein